MLNEFVKQSSEHCVQSLAVKFAKEIIRTANTIWAEGVLLFLFTFSEQAQHIKNTYI